MKSSATSDVHIFMLTAKGSLNDRIEGLKIGADEYLIKPFSPRELTARVNALFRRLNGKVHSSSVMFDDGNLQIDCEKRTVKVCGEERPFTPNEFDILKILVANKGKVFLQKSVNILAGKLKYQDSLRRRLVSDISHEIRTPLNVLQNKLEAMIDGVYPVTTKKLYYLNEEVIRFGKLINSLNTLKEFETESTKLSYESIYLDEFILEICKDFYMDAEKKHISLDYSIQPNRKYLMTGDKDQLKQVFINLFSNAIKFTEPNGRVLIQLYENDKNIVVEVCDNGIGILEEDLPYIFERLYRGDISRQKIEGNGIGLTIVKNILQLHNAVIGVESKEGNGSKFTIYFAKNEVSK
ncbi:ATP-binding protein [Neobacillus sp. NPDC097160]|uniref:ATP-binding response regulator n=1 Tax=Neobacillus sp. NPDC097160 TaxID=3364298 RepID=UPI003816A392